MKNLLFSLFVLVCVVFSLSAVSAVSGNCNYTMPQTTQAFFNEISTIDSILQICPIYIQGSVNSLVGNGDVEIDVTMNSGNVESFYITINNKQITHVTYGAAISPSYVVTTSEITVDRILSSSDIMNEILVAYNNNEIKITAKGFFNKIKFFFAKFFIPSGNSNTGNKNTVHGKPNYCDETYLSGHSNYAENKELWDSYSYDADKVCQSQYGKGIPSPCVHSVQLSVDGNPYYLCWYNEW